jgi:hypothetical protein
MTINTPFPRGIAVTRLNRCLNQGTDVSRLAKMTSTHNVEGELYHRKFFWSSIKFACTKNVPKKTLKS